ncbi:2-hydroxyacid dehydrogenase [Commensalibacter papalotli (ex Botero et al. 2024)]|uniref:Lactate dehydrogenase or related 2-hydroxyacid dehydrogenase (LdhA) (PDB:1DXY) n=1 Tax=Commensalibacter papalotli (ex Botero et al. 2024) TaxID=2972766 RepID=A0ABN8WH73_9PROT|nr:2-hydroxyacid dehydrogenase [Commensalibacter papalotli (ex Botero et al. 2024)]CAI3953411.1 Lactate dehydrogenase or related 2-hydroxyacid dehydrogenase (LdhA) (PDB:1DXY) [Commensalibacter papalotli (ex Botero et al. 2024)]CAI3953921.1 Lactate dehydrogenase or related 2-hydroxyacid dehydrogenase (LdhA) (PDB:1DXY) [Commensalibacter papalotli (ex Botero et al. 2024)]
MKPEILQLVPMNQSVQEQVNQNYINHIVLDGLPSTDILNKVEAVITNGVIGAPTEMLNALPNVKLITVHGVGYDNVDTDLLKKRNIKLSIATNVPTQDVADMAIGLLLNVARQLNLRDQFIREGKWETERCHYQGTSISNKKVGIMGMGPIGRAIAQRISAFDNEVSYTARHQHTDVKWNFVPSLLDLAKQSDIFIIAASGGDNSRKAVNQEIIEAIGERGFLINIGRGVTVDEEALIECLQNKKIAGAGLDVFADEPHVPQALKDLSNIVMAPHSAGATYETSKNISIKILNSLNDYFAGRSLPDEVKL